MFDRNSVTRDLASRDKQFHGKAKKVRYACPHCRKRFKAHPQRTAYSPFPMCRRCGTPVGDKHRTVAFDRTRRYGWLALKWASCPVWGPLLGKYYAARWALRKVCRIGGRLGSVAKLPVKGMIHILSWWKNRRFATPEELMDYMREAGYEHMIGSPEPPELAGEKAPGLAQVSREPHMKETKDPSRESLQVTLSHVGKAKLPDSIHNPYDLVGTTLGSKEVRSEGGALKLHYEVLWENGEKGMYEAEDLSEM